MPKAKNGSPTKTPSKPRTASKGDELGKNKKQQTLHRYFSPSPKKFELPVNKTDKKPRKQLFIGETHIKQEIIVIDSGGDSDQKSVENFHPKVKSLSKSTEGNYKAVTKFNSDNSYISRSTINASSNHVDVSVDGVQKKTGDKQFSKQLVKVENVEENVLQTIKPSNKPSFLSTKSRKRKSENQLSDHIKSEGISVETSNSMKFLTVKTQPVDSSISVDPPPFSPCQAKHAKPALLPNKESDTKFGSCYVTTSSGRFATSDDLVAIETTNLNVRSMTSNVPNSFSASENERSQTNYLEKTQDKNMNVMRKPLSLSLSKMSPLCSKAGSTYISKESDDPAKTSIKSNESVALSTEEIVTLHDVDWSEPMEEEVKLTSSPVKTPSTSCSGSPRTPKKSDIDAIISKALTPKKLWNSPMKTVPTTPSQLPRTPPRSPKKRSPRKIGSPTKLDADAASGNLLLEHCIQECKRFAQMAFKLNSRNKKVAENYLSLCAPEKILLHRLLMRKWTWIRDVDMKYDKIVHNKVGSLNILRNKGFVEDMNQNEELLVILDKMRLPELTEICKGQKLDVKGTKNELINRLVDFTNLQGDLGFGSKSLKSVLKDKAFTSLGKCVRLLEGSREALQSIFEASMSPIYLEGQFYTFQERLLGMANLMNDVKFNGKKLIPFSLSDVQMFKTTMQFDEYISSVVLKFNILSAKAAKNNSEAVKLARDASTSLMIYLHSNVVQEFLNKTPKYLWKYTAGSNYTSALDTGIEFFKRSKEYDTAMAALEILLGQGVFRKHCRGHWYAEKVLILDKHLKKGASEIYPVVLTGLKEDLTQLGRLELSKKAESLLNKKKGKLTPSEKSEIWKLMRVPQLDHKVNEIKGTEAPNMSTNTRQMFVEVSASGEKVYSNVEQIALNSYSDEYPEGEHDEGSFLKNIILAAFWPVIYMPLDNMFISKYQSRPLDWGTQTFYKNRQQEIKNYIEFFREGGIDSVVQQISDVVDAYLHCHSVINWSYIAHGKLSTIKNVITCLTLSKFLLLADYLLESYRERRSGWPDLTLWNAASQKLKLVEVKSTNDELSLKQIIWLEKFSELGIDVEECRVNAAHKRKKRKAGGGEELSEVSQEVI